MKQVNNFYTYLLENGKAKGFFNIYQAKNGKIILQMGNCFTPLSIEQIQNLNIDCYNLIGFSHEDFENAYPNSVYSLPKIN